MSWNLVTPCIHFTPHTSVSGVGKTGLSKNIRPRNVCLWTEWINQRELLLTDPVVVLLCCLYAYCQSDFVGIFLLRYFLQLWLHCTVCDPVLFQYTISQLSAVKPVSPVCQQGQSFVVFSSALSDCSKNSTCAVLIRNRCLRSAAYNRNKTIFLLLSERCFCSFFWRWP